MSYDRNNEVKKAKERKKLKNTQDPNYIYDYDKALILYLWVSRLFIADYEYGQ